MYLFFILTLCLPFQVPLVETWELTSESEFLECPDYLQFTNQNEILIINDCYGLNPNIAGTSNYKLSDNSIKLSNLSFTSNYRSFSEQPVDRIQYEVKFDTLYLTIFSNEKRIEKYVRLME